jgi:hypothetical protein
MKVLIRMCAGAWVSGRGHFDLSCQDVLSSWHMTVVPCHVSRLHTGVYDLGGAYERS